MLASTVLQLEFFQHPALYVLYNVFIYEFSTVEVEDV